MKATFMYRVDNGKEKRDTPVTIDVPDDIATRLREMANQAHFNAMFNGSNVDLTKEE